MGTPSQKFMCLAAARAVPGAAVPLCSSICLCIPLPNGVPAFSREGPSARGRAQGPLISQAPRLTDAAVRARKAVCALAAKPVHTVHADAAIVAGGERGQVCSRQEDPGLPPAVTHQGRGLQSLVSEEERTGQ